MHSSTLLEVLSYELTAICAALQYCIHGNAGDQILQRACVHVHSEYAECAASINHKAIVLVMSSESETC